MYSESKSGASINLPTSTETLLEPSDQTWLDSYGVDPSWQDSDELVAELNQLIADGSKHLNDTGNQAPEAHDCVMLAREKFFSFVGIPDETLRAFRENRGTLIPVDTFVKSQRTMIELEIDVAKTIGSLPAALSYAPESIRAKFDNLTELGLDAVKVINSSPAVIGLAPKSIREKFDTIIELGLDATKIFNTQPAALSYAPESIRAKFDNLTQIGLDAVNIINAIPSVIGLASESIRAKVDNLTELGLDSVKVINAAPTVIGYAPESIRAKFDNLTELELDAAKVINAIPSVIGLASESIRAKVDNLTELGLDAVKVINAAPTSISLAPESIRAKFDNLTELGLDAVKVINTKPSTLNYASESIRVKLDDLTKLGLDAVKVINTAPSVISLAPETIRGKVRFIQKSANVLQWGHSALELIETYPAILGYSIEKLKVLRRIAAYRINASERSLAPGILKSALITPLEQYVIALAESENTDKMDIVELRKIARRNKESAPERRERAVQLAPSLGKIGLAYSKYKK